MSSPKERDPPSVLDPPTGNPEPLRGTRENADIRNESPAEGANGPSSRGFSMEEILDAGRRDITPEVNSVIRKLLDLQKRCNMSTRFHLLVEQDVDNVVTQWAKHDDTGVQNCSRTCTRILMSPTLSFDTDEMRKVSMPMTRQLSAASFVGMRAAFQRERETTETGSSGQGSRTLVSVGSLPSQPNRVGPTWEPFDEWEDVSVPDWFPFLYERYTSGPQFSDTEILEIPDGVVRKFESLSKETIEAIWPLFFRTLHEAVRKNDRRYPRLSFKYTLYTPPWLRRQIKTGHQVHRIGEVTIRPMRSQRSDWGHRTMALILAGFYENERYFSRSVLNHILTNMPSAYRGVTQGSQMERGLGNNPRGGNRTKAKRSQPCNRRLSSSGPLSTGPRKIRLDENRRPIQEGRKNDKQEVESVLPDTNEAGNSTAVPAAGQQYADRHGETLNEGDASPPKSEKTQNGKEKRESKANETPLVIVCGARSACLLRLDPEAQVLSKITGKCSNCRCALHDLCGGGEEGDMLCYNCRIARSKS